MKTHRKTMAVIASAILSVGVLTGASSVEAGTRGVGAVPQLGLVQACACEYYGSSVALSGTTALVGERGAGNGSGAAVIYTGSGQTWTPSATLVGHDTATSDYFGASRRSLWSHRGRRQAPNHKGGRVYVFSLSAGRWKQTAELKGGDTVDGDWFGAAVAVAGNEILVGAPMPHGHTGGAYVFVESGGRWTQQPELLGADSSTGGYFGYSVAIEGRTAVVGAPSQSTSGRAYIFGVSSGVWSETDELSPPGSTAVRNFGCSVAFSEATAVVGAWHSKTGSAYIYVHVAGTWTNTAQLQVNEGTEDLGASVAIYENTVVVGGVLAWGSSGSAYVFKELAGVWTQTAQLTPNPSTGIVFFANRSLAIYNSTVVVGAPGFGGGPGHGGSGAVFFYSHVASGTWQQTATETQAPSYVGAQLGSSLSSSGSTALIGAPGQGIGGRACLAILDLGTFTPTLPVQATGEEDGDRFGASVSLSGAQGLVGAPGKEGGGAAYVFTETSAVPFSAGTVRCLPGPIGADGSFSPGECRAWLETALLESSDRSPGDQFGAAVALSSTRAAVGAPSHAGTGAVSTFLELGSKWERRSELRGSDSSTGDLFGYSVALSGTTLVVGAPGRAGGGRAYVFVNSSGSWSQVAELAGADITGGDGFGSSVALSGPDIVVGAPGHPGGGRAYVFVNSSGSWSQVAELAGADTTGGDGFGSSVSVAGAYAVVGAPGHAGIGEMYVFGGSGASWSPAGEVDGSNRVAGDEFGTAVSVSDKIAFSSAPDFSKVAPDAGATYAFQLP